MEGKGSRLKRYVDEGRRLDEHTCEMPWTNLSYLFKSTGYSEL